MELLKSLLLCLSFFFGLSSFTLAATYVVDKSGAGDFTTIQAAVNQAAALENMGPSRGYAYFVRASDMVYISGGLSSLQIGMLISVDDRNWYEIAQIVDSETQYALHVPFMKIVDSTITKLSHLALLKSGQASTSKKLIWQIYISFISKELDRQGSQ